MAVIYAMILIYARSKMFMLLIVNVIDKNNKVLDYWFGLNMLNKIILCGKIVNNAE